MKHLTMAEKSLLVGDEVAGLLLEYAALLARTDGADTVEIDAIGDDGDPVTVNFLLNAGTVLLSESSHADFAEPDNRRAVEYLRSQMDRIEHPPMSGAEDESAVSEPQWEL